MRKLRENCRWSWMPEMNALKYSPPQSWPRVKKAVWTWVQANDCPSRHVLISRYAFKWLAADIWNLVEIPQWRMNRWIQTDGAGKHLCSPCWDLVFCLHMNQQDKTTIATERWRDWKKLFHLAFEGNKKYSQNTHCNHVASCFSFEVRKNCCCVHLEDWVWNFGKFLDEILLNTLLEGLNNPWKTKFGQFGL